MAEEQEHDRDLVDVHAALKLTSSDTRAVCEGLVDHVADRPRKRHELHELELVDDRLVGLAPVLVIEVAHLDQRPWLMQSLQCCSCETSARMGSFGSRLISHIAGSFTSPSACLLLTLRPESGFAFAVPIINS